MTHSWVSSDNQWREIIRWCCQLRIAKGNLLAKPHAGHSVCALKIRKAHFFSPDLEPTCSALKHRQQAAIPCNLQNNNSSPCVFSPLLCPHSSAQLRMGSGCVLLWPSCRESWGRGPWAPPAWAFFSAGVWLCIRWGNMSAGARALPSLARDMRHMLWLRAGRTLRWQLELGRS